MLFTSIRLRFGLRHALMLLATMCAFASPPAMLIKQAQAGELLRVLCTAEGKKAVTGSTASHDCPHCCVGSLAGPAAAQPEPGAFLAHYAAVTTSIPNAVINAAFLIPAATGPPLIA
jgi:hypothetical protein